MAEQIDRTDGLSMEFADWRFNIRTSNTEPLLRLNVETKGYAEKVQIKVSDLETFIK
ncbi:phosphomannomutase/phosphoglucomutase [compost metagenome]